MLTRIKRALKAPKKVEQVFLWVAIPFLSFFVFAVPALQGWDEGTHFLRAYQVSEGNVLPDRFENGTAGGLLPIEIVRMHDVFLSDLVLSAQSNLERSVNGGGYAKYIQTNSPGEVRAQKEFTAGTIYSPVGYLPAAAGIALARVLDLPLLLYIYVARIFMAAAFIALMYWAIRLIPKGKWVLFAVALLPQAATMGVSMGLDALLVGTISLLVALYMKFRIEDKVITAKELLLVGGLSAILALTKQPYALVLLLFFLLPIRRYGSWKRFAIGMGAVACVVGLLGLVWFVQVDDLAKNIHLVQRQGLHVDPDEQLEGIVSNPAGYGALLANQITTGKSNAVYMQLNGAMTWKGISLPLWLLFVSYLFLVLAFLFTRQEKDEPGAAGLLARFAPLAIAAMIVAAVYTSLYLGFSIVGSSTVEGINGRYFVPILPLLIPVFGLYAANAAVRIEAGKAKRLFVGGTVAVLAIATVVLIAANYVPHIFKG